MATDIESLRAAVRLLLVSHPNITAFDPHFTIHIERYVTLSGEPLAHESDRTTIQNLWTTGASVRASRLSSIPHRLYAAHESRNHHLSAIPAFRDAPLLCFRITSIWQAVRVIEDVAGA